MINWIVGLSTIGSISFGCALVAGKNRVPNPAAGMIALRTVIWVPLPFVLISYFIIIPARKCKSYTQKLDTHAERTIHT
jgi:hypothetical protein